MKKTLGYILLALSISGFVWLISSTVYDQYCRFGLAGVVFIWSFFALCVAFMIGLVYLIVWLLKDE